MDKRGVGKYTYYTRAYKEDLKALLEERKIPREKAMKSEFCNGYNNALEDVIRWVNGE